SALVDVHRSMAVDSEIGLDVAGERPPDLSDNESIEILRIVGEALTNARRHAGARHIQVSARSSESRLSVEVSDDGYGFDSVAEPSRSDSAGLQGMRERSALLGGKLDIRSAP